MYNITVNDLDINKLNDNTYLEEIKLYKKKVEDYNILTYIKSEVNSTNIDKLGLFRSLIINMNTKKCVCFSPPKTHKYEIFKVNNKDIGKIEITELIDGTMINLFYDNNKWNISTKNTIDAKTKFNKDGPTFYEMFLDAEISANLDYGILDKNKCYSFVLQHPSNRIISPSVNPRLHLTNVYKILNNNKGIVIEEISIYSNEINSMLDKNNRQIWRPRKNIYNNSITTYNKIENDYNSRTVHAWFNKGIVLYNNMVRTKYMNPLYNDISNMIGNHPKLQYLYLTLRYNNQVKEYLRYYREHRLCFSSYRLQIHNFTKNLFKFYIRCKISKDKPISEYPYEYRTHLYNLHKIYIDELREKKECITYTKVVEYVNKLEPPKLMYSINYNLIRLNK